MSQRPRPRIPAHVKRLAALMSPALPAEVVMGEVPGEIIEWDHEPALGIREFDPETGQYTPDANDPRYITPRVKSQHHIKTNGTKATTAGSDKQQIAKAKRMEEARLADEAAAAESDEAAYAVRRRLTRPQPRDDRPKAKIPSRPFQQRPKKAKRSTA